MQSRAGYGAPAASPPTQTFRPDLYSNGRGLTSNASYGNAYGLERRPSERAAPPPTLATATSDPATFGQEVRSSTTILIRRLSRTVTRETLASMLLFTRDLSDTEFVSSPYPEDSGYAAAHARFHSPAGAVEAQQKLHGKLNSTGDTNMIVEIRGTTTPGTFERRNTIDGVAATRTQTSSASSGGSGAGPPSRSRFGSAYHNQDASPPLLTPSSGASADFPSPETNPHFQSLFSPQSSLTNGIDDRHRSSGKYIINNDAVDDETGELLKDPVAYARNGQTQSAARRQTNPQSLVNRFNDLAVSTDGVNEQYGHQMSSHANGYQSPRAVASSRFPLSPTMSQNGGPVTSPQRPPLPPVNPADQNPPCNTLYVGNLPIDTSEDELKAVFSKQRGYKRLCFRTKQNGPMCFVEFEDVSFATKALNDLYGHPLHNSVKGGIRLSFSKNPLGVRSGQTNGMAPHLAMSPHAMAPGYGMSAGSNFSSVSGPPPGLSSPPGLVNANGHRAPPQNHGDNGMFANPFGMPTSDYSNQMHARGMTHGMSPAMNATAYPRDHRLGYSDYAVGRY